MRNKYHGSESRQKENFQERRTRNDGVEENNVEGKCLKRGLK